FHSGQVRLTRRFNKGISANFFYTYGRSIDNSSTFGGAGNTVAQNNNDLHAERGLSSFDMRHQLTLNYVLTSPFGPSAALIPATGWTARLLADWTVSGGLTYHTGTPITARVLGNRSDTVGSGVVGSGRADATGLPVNSGDGFFDLLAFTIPP